MSCVEIKVTTMGFRVPVSERGAIIGTSLDISDFVRPFEQWSYNPRFGRMEFERTFLFFDLMGKTLYLPKWVLKDFETYLITNGVTYKLIDVPPVIGVETKFMMLPHINYKNHQQKNAVEYLTNDSVGCLRPLGIQTGFGKEQPLDSMIKIPGGWIQMGDIRHNDIISMPDGTGAPVIGIYSQGKKDIYRVRFEDGRWTDCGLDHLWKVHYVQWYDVSKSKEDMRWRVITTEQIIEYMKKPTYAKRMYVPLIEPEIMEDIDLPIDPYVLGVLIGDGSLCQPTITVCKPDQFIKDELDRILYPHHKTSEWYPDKKSYSIVRCGDNPHIRHVLEDLGVMGKRSWEKTIPPIYMKASPRQKLALIQGLMDTDDSSSSAPGKNGLGSKCSTVEFCTTSKTLADQYQYIIRSLGGLCKKVPRFTTYEYNGEKRTGRESYRCTPRMKDPSVLFRLPRKKERLVGDYQYSDSLKLKIKSIEYIGQKEAQCIEVDHPDHLYITDDYIVTHNTVAYIWAVQKIGRRSMTVMTSRLEQWLSVFGKYTTLDDEDAYLISGVGSLSKLFAQIDQGISPSMIVASSRTLQLYMEYGPSYRHLPHPEKMCEILGIGIWGTDEYHENFRLNFQIGTMMNPAVFIPITATFTANEQFTKTIFDKTIPSMLQFSGGEYEKIANVTAYTYRGGAHVLRPNHYMGPKGYSQAKFEKFLLSPKGKHLLACYMEDVIVPIVENHYLNIHVKGEKCLFLCALTEMCTYLQNEFRRRWKHKTTSIFISGMSSSILEKFDFIISTPGSAGTGRDIDNLRTCIVMDSTNSETRNMQYLGRLRPFPSVKNTPEFCYITWRCVQPQVNYSNRRAALYGPRSLKFTHRSV